MNGWVGILMKGCFWKALLKFCCLLDSSTECPTNTANSTNLKLTDMFYPLKIIPYLLAIFPIAQTPSPTCEYCLLSTPESDILSAQLTPSFSPLPKPNFLLLHLHISPLSSRKQTPTSSTSPYPPPLLFKYRQHVKAHFWNGYTSAWYCAVASPLTELKLSEFSHRAT